MSKRAFTYELVQDGIVVASATAPTDFQAKATILHYAMQYLDDGPVTIREEGPELSRHERLKRLVEGRP